MPYPDDPEAIPSGKVIRKAIIRAYTVGTHKADVQIVGSHPTLLNGIRVATDIPAADVVTGRQCTVLFLDPSNQDDALVLTIQGALPSAGAGGGPPDILESGDLVKADADPIDFKGGFDVAVDGTGVNVTLDIDEAPLSSLAQLSAANAWLALQTFSAGLQLAATQAIKDSGGAARITPSTTGVRIDGHLAINTAVSPYFLSLLQETSPTTYFGLQFTLVHSGSTTGVRGVNAAMAYSGSAVSPEVIGGYYQATHRSDYASGATLIGIHARHVEDNPSVPVGWLQSIGFRAGTPTYTGAQPASQYGFYAQNQGVAGIANVYGAYIANQTSGSSVNRLFEALGLSATNARIEAGDPTNPGAGLGRAQLLLAFNENGSINVRRIQHKLFSAAVAGDRMLVAV